MEKVIFRSKRKGQARGRRAVVDFDGPALGLDVGVSRRGISGILVAIDDVENAPLLI